MASQLLQSLIQRITSGVIIAGPALAAIIYGTPYFNIMVSILGLLMAWEWSKLCLNEFKLPGIILSLYIGAIPLLPLVGFELVEALKITPVIVVLLFALGPNSKGKLWFAIGALYLSVPVVAFEYLRDIDAIGFEVVLWLVLLVIATDTGGYAFGLTIGGPKLAPRISPKKTWAGLFGGMFGATLISYIAAISFDWNEPIFIAGSAALLAVIAQMGDLFESHVKRRFDVKDSSNLIPGHGGILDRLDGMLTGGTAVAGAILATGGSILEWF